MKALVSIIVPVYNVQQYLDRCLKSLVGQTYQNIEILLVDDGSRDSSGELCDLWGTRDDRIRVFHKKNGGLSDVRNYGLQRANGEYVCFVDSDDWCDTKYIEVMYGALAETGSDIIECDYLCVDSEKDAVSEEIDYPRAVFCGRECFYRFLTDVFFVSVCNKLYRKDLIADEWFKPGVYHEDEYWTYKIFSKAQRVCRIRYTGYFYYQRQNSITHSKPSRKKIMDAFTAGKERIDFIEDRYPEYAAIGYSAMMHTCMYLFNKAEYSDASLCAIQEELAAYFRVILVKYLKKRQYKKEMWRFLVFRVFPKWYCKYEFSTE